jgi:hypothetical protein
LECRRCGSGTTFLKFSSEAQPVMSDTNRSMLGDLPLLNRGLKNMYWVAGLRLHQRWVMVVTTWPSTCSLAVPLADQRKIRDKHPRTDTHAATVPSHRASLALSCSIARFGAPKTPDPPS